LSVRAEHLYVHVPFCARRCVYCDFSIAVRAKVPVRAYADALDRELTTRHGSSELELQTLYFGGGTPSKLGSDGVKAVMDVVRSRSILSPGAEVTLEANPEDITRDAVRAWIAAGINRVSLGVQSFDDRVLAWMHRTHDSQGARRSVDVLRDAGMPNLSIDLIFATPSELGRSWVDDLRKTVDLELPHVSVYGLTVEPRTPLGRRVARFAEHEEPEDTFEAEFLEADAILTASGLEHYEVSNYGRPGMHSRHNWAYWKRAPYVGVGPSAHEFDGRVRHWNVEPYAEWERRLAEGIDPTEGTEELTDAEAANETTYLALRTTTGAEITADATPKVKSWISAGWAEFAESRLRLTPSGWLRIDSITNDLTAFRSRF
jgi:oxygen-independent coproporphyrinogen III oxidase